MTGWLIALGILVLLAILPVGASLIYNEDGLFLSLLLGRLKIKLFPKPPKEKKKEKKEKPKKQKKEAPKQKPEKPKEKSGGKLTDFLPLVKIAVRFLGSFRRKLRLNRLELNLIMAGGDPCDLAVNYGKAWAALGNLDPQLERLFVIKKKKLEIECDFTADQTLIFARLDLTITLGRLLKLAFRYGVKALREYLKIYKTIKGGALQ